MGSVMQKYYLNALGIVSWKRRTPKLSIEHYAGLSDNGGWLLIAEAAQHDEPARCLVESMGRVLGIHETHFAKTLLVDDLFSHSFQRVLVLGDNLVDALSIDRSSCVCHDKACVLAPDLKRLIAAPLMKKDLWQKLKPLLPKGGLL